MRGAGVFILPCQVVLSMLSISTLAYAGCVLVNVAENPLVKVFGDTTFL